MKQENRPDREQADAAMCFLLSQRQGIGIISFLLGKPEHEIRRLIEIGRARIERLTNR
jgi:hypothetical protein